MLIPSLPGCGGGGAGTDAAASKDFLQPLSRVLSAFRGRFGAYPQFSRLWEGESLLLRAFQEESTALAASVSPFCEGIEFPGKALWEHPSPIP